MKLLKLVVLVACVSASIPAGAQGPTPALNFDAANPLTLPDDIYLGEVGGVATSSRGDIYVYTRTGHPTTAGEIAKMRLDGTMIGKFGKAGKLPKEFGTVNAIDCRNESTLYVGEIGNFRVQKVTMK
jgi:hypothetical protein